MSCNFCNREFGRSFSVKHHHTQIQQPDNGQIVQSKNDTSGIVLWRRGRHQVTLISSIVHSVVIN